MNRRVTLAVSVQAALLTGLWTPARVAAQENKSKVPEAIRLTEKAVAEHEVFAKYFKITKSEYNEKTRKFSWLLEAKAKGSASDVRLFELSRIRFIDADKVVLARVRPGDTFELSAKSWDKDENVRGSLQLPKDLDLEKVKTVDIVDP